MASDRPARADFCKWVDEEGVTHYAQECPADSNSQPVSIDSPPSRERVYDAMRAYEQGETSADELNDAREQIGRRTDPNAERTAAGTNLEACLRARFDLEILKIQRPLYFDDSGVLHHDRSYHSLNYEGPRNFVADEDRPALIASRQEAVANTCSDSEEEQQLYSNETVERLREAICEEKRWRLANWESGTTGLPDPRVRELREEIDRSCN